MRDKICTAFYLTVEVCIYSYHCVFFRVSKMNVQKLDTSLCPSLTKIEFDIMTVDKSQIVHKIFNEQNCYLQHF